MTARSSSRPRRSFLEGNKALAQEVRDLQSAGATAPTSPATAPAKKRGSTAPKPDGQRANEASKARQKLEDSAKKASNIWISSELDDRVGQLKAKLKVSNGDLLIMAVESEVNRLDRNESTIGGSLFAPRPASSHVARNPSSRCFSFRIRPSDFTVLDRLAEEHDFATRTELIEACLKAFCDHHGI